MKSFQTVIFGFILLIGTNVVIAQYLPTWDSLDKHPLPQWYDDAKIGIFIHWGLFSVPSFGSEWFWENWKNSARPTHQRYVDFINKNYPPNWTYADFGPQFTAEFYEPDKWADLFKASGAKYMVLTSKHHEGFTMWPSKYSWNWNAMDVGPKRDLLGDLAKSIRNRTDLHFGLYHSLFEWFNPLYDYDLKHNTTLFVDQKTMPELYEIVNTYHPEIIWSDGSYGSDVYWKSKEFIAWLYNESPVKDRIVVNDRWGGDSGCKHGDFFNCKDRYNPKTLNKHKWENCFTLDKYSWGFRREAVLNDYLTIKEMLTTIAETVSCNGNVLINVGPTHEGRIVPIQEQRLRQLGEWLKINGEAIYGSTFWSYQNDTVTPGVWYTSKPKDTGSPFYAIVLDWPTNGELELGAVTLAASSVVRMLGYNTVLTWKNSTEGFVVEFPQITSNLPLINNLQWVAVLKFIK